MDKMVHNFIIIVIVPISMGTRYELIKFKEY